MDYEVGKYYKVKCAVIVNWEGVERFLVPVVGEIHKDPQLGADWLHVHIDGRFINNYISIDKDGRTNHILKFSKDRKNYEYTFENFVYKIRKCVRSTTGLNVPEGAKKYWNWYMSMVGKSCKGKRCPHLGTTMIDVNGKLFCPLHNLVGCPKKEIIIEP